MVTQHSDLPKGISAPAEIPADAADPQQADQLAANRAAADRRFLMVGGGIFLAIMTAQYLFLVFDKPEPLPWERGQSFQAFRVDVNAATWIEWSQLDGIGPSLAHRIVADRKINGPFRSLDDVERVEGIGPKTLESIRPWLTIRSDSEDLTAGHPDTSSP